MSPPSVAWSGVTGLPRGFVPKIERFGYDQGLPTAPRRLVVDEFWQPDSLEFGPR